MAGQDFLCRYPIPDRVKLALYSLTFGNRRLARAQAALVALLYVFLSTFGTLTHTHSRVEEIDPEAVAVPARSGPPALRLAANTHSTPSGVLHCAFCDWQANSVSPALTAQHCVSPLLAALAAASIVVLPVRAHYVHTSTRAPPTT